MAKGSGGTRVIRSRTRTVGANIVPGEEIITQSEAVTRRQLIEAAAPLKGEYTFDNGISGRYEIKQRDLHNLVYEMSRELYADRENIINNIRSIIESGKYVGWSPVDPSKHPNVAYFAYFSKELGKNVYLGLRYFRSRRLYKPYAVYSEEQFAKRVDKIKEGIPTM